MIRLLNDVKLYCRIDSDDEDDLLNEMIAAAKNQIFGQCGKTSYVNGEVEPIRLEDTELFKLAVKMLVAHWYDNRGAVSVGEMKNIPYAVDSIIAEFRLNGAYI